MRERTDEPRLAPPGGGIPRVERWVAKGLINVYAQTAKTESVLDRFRTEVDGVLASAQGLSEAEGSRPVLVARLVGLEDSSRYWSVYMVLEHLVIVTRAVMLLLPALARGRGGLQEVRIEEVKPKPEAGAEQLQRLRNTAERYREVVLGIGDLQTAARHAHPWFGPLDARGWNALTALHVSLHRRQLRRIIKELRR